MTDITLILDFTIIFLLITAIVYGFVLNRRIRLIRDSGRELSHLFRSFDDTILKAQASIADLKKVSGEVSEGLQKKIDKAALLADELEFLGEKASNSAEKASTAIANFKKMENRIPVSDNTTDKSRNVVAMPLITSPPLRQQTKSFIPEKPASKFKNKKGLEDLLEEISVARQTIQKKAPEQNNIKSNNVVVAHPQKIQEENTIEKKQFSIASALKVLGYGD